jgi:predicted nucleotidyltransferase component of viral defense system
MASKILTPLQKTFISKVSENNKLIKGFYLTGGTALAEYYLQHRYSEDLDFFSIKEINIMGINVFLKKISPLIKIKKIDFQQSFNRNIFFLHTRREILKTEFTYFPFEQVVKPNKQNGIFIDSLTDIAVNKLFTIFQNPRARDFIDLYFILKLRKGLTLKKLVSLARIKFDSNIDPIQLGTQLFKAKTISDLPNMIIKIDSSLWRNFFSLAAKSLSKEIFSS